ncbi:PepSY domain-containing protein [Microvirga zambiensis]|uniref:PepSY domain-containing protein n=1 Tax=Microvirga zambiensis TaxID=1402137 RepID=UPI001920193A|nr:PepSY domain-containing protein [Microvirga zambiensis]
MGQASVGYRVRIVTEDHFANASVDPAQPGSVTIDQQGMIERLMQASEVTRYWRALRFSLPLGAAVTEAERETDGTAASVRTDLFDDGERPRFTVQVMDDNVSRTVTIDGWTGSVLDVIPPDPGGRRGR